MGFSEKPTKWHVNDRKHLTHQWPIVPHYIETFAMQINWLVSIWWRTLVVNGLIQARMVKLRNLKWKKEFGSASKT